MLHHLTRQATAGRNCSINAAAKIIKYNSFQYLQVPIISSRRRRLSESKHFSSSNNNQNQNQNQNHLNNNTSHPYAVSCNPTNNSRYNTNTETVTVNVTKSLRRFSSQSIKSVASITTAQTLSSEDDMINPVIDTTTTTNGKKTPSILTTLPPDYETGQAWSLLQTKGKGGNFIRLAEFHALASSAKKGTPKDAMIIRTALRDLKRCNSFIVDEECCRVALEGVQRALTPFHEEGLVTGRTKVNSGTWIAKLFLDEKTGLYYATQTKYVEEYILGWILEGVIEVGAELEVEKAKEVSTVVSDIIHSLLRRVSNPSKEMKKRAAREYNKHLKVSHGPFPPTVHMGVKICLELRKSDIENVVKARQMITSFEDMRFLGIVSDETRSLVQKAEEELKQLETDPPSAVDTSEGNESEDEEKNI